MAGTTENDNVWAEVVPLYRDRDLEDDDAPLRLGEKRPCLHRKTRLDRDAHRLYCHECDAEVDPFAFLVRLAGEWGRWVTHRKEAERRAKAAHERLEETLRLERNARARLKKLDPTVTPPERPWGEGSFNS